MSGYSACNMLRGWLTMHTPRPRGLGCLNLTKTSGDISNTADVGAGVQTSMRRCCFLQETPAVESVLLWRRSV